MSPPNLMPYKAVVVDLTYPMENMLEAIDAYVEQERTAFTVKELMGLSVTHLQYSFMLKEAIEAMMIELQTYAFINWTHEVVLRLEAYMERFMVELHRRFHEMGFYDGNGEFAYVVGGWVDSYVPYFVPRAALDVHCTRIAIQHRLEQPRLSSLGLPVPVYPEDPEDQAIPWRQPAGVFAPSYPAMWD